MCLARACLTVAAREDALVDDRPNACVPRFTSAVGLAQAPGSFKRSRSMDSQDVACDGCNGMTVPTDSPLRKMPHEVALKILSCLSAADLAVCSQVCKAFREYASDDSLWRRLYFGR